MRAEDLIPAVTPAYGQETAQLVLDIVRTFPERHAQHDWIADPAQETVASWEQAQECGATACIAGWAAWIHRAPLEIWITADPEKENEYVEFMYYFGATVLGLNEADAEQLFYRTNNEQAVRALEYIAKGELIDWDVVKPQQSTMCDCVTCL